MSDNYPWEEGSAADWEAEGGTPVDDSSAQMELESTPTDQPEQAAAEPGSRHEGQPGESAAEPGSRHEGQPGESVAESGSRQEGQPEEPASPVARPVMRERPVARKEYYSIGEVSELAGLPPHVLRYWESQFSVLSPSKNRSGNRAYQRKEIKLILLVKHLLYEEKYTVEGAKAKLDQLRRGGVLPEHTGRALDAETLALLREDVARLRELLALD